jgi:dipeptidyl aminopeptidase/acylaminoacyl peptidase
MKSPLPIIALTAVLSACAPTRSIPDAKHHAATFDPVAVNIEFPPAMREISFESGGSKLNGLVYIADGPGPHPTTILLHGYAGNERNLDLAQALRRAGTNVVYFNYRGTWGSGGTFSIPHALEDVAHVVARARDAEWTSAYRADPDQVALVGHSFGGFLGALTTAEDESLSCYAHLAGADLGTFGLLARADAEFRSALSAGIGADMDPEGGPIHGDIGAFMDDLVDRGDAYSLPSHAAAIASRPLMVVAGTRDEAVPKEMHHDPLMAALREAGAEAVTEVVYDDDHSFSSHRVDLARRLVDWQREECWR